MVCLYPFILMQQRRVSCSSCVFLYLIYTLFYYSYLYIYIYMCSNPDEGGCLGNVVDISFSTGYDFAIKNKRYVWLCNWSFSTRFLLFTLSAQVGWVLLLWVCAPTLCLLNSRDPLDKNQYQLTFEELLSSKVWFLFFMH